METRDEQVTTELFFEALAVIMAWRLRPRFQATVRYRVGTDAEQRLAMDADPTILRYSISSPDGLLLERYDGYAHTSEQGGRSEILGASEIINEAIPARLAFPMSLPIWGRRLDEYRLTGSAQASGDNIELGLIHTANERTRGTLVVSIPRRLAITLSTPTITIGFENFS